MLKAEMATRFTLMEFKFDTHITPSAGKILISEPFLQDPFFKRSVVLLCKHNDTEGSFGLVLNRFLEVSLSEVVEEFPTIDCRVGVGGPVEPSSLFYIHNVGDKIKGGMHVYEDIYLGGDYEQIKDLILTGNISEENIRFFIGYSGWGKNQLKEELKEHSWLVADMPSKVVMGTDETSFWEEAIKNLGEEFRVLANFPNDPSLN